MLIKLLRDARIKHYAGEVVEASPAEVSYLTSVGSAVRIGAEPEAEAPEAPKAETPEAERPKRKRRAVKKD